MKAFLPKHKQKTFSAIAVLLLFTASFLAPIHFLFADEINEIQQEIDSQNARLEEIRQDLADSQAQVEKYKANQSSLYGQRYQVQTELDAINAQIAENTNDIDDLGSGVATAESLVATRISQRDSKMKNLYMDIKLPFIDKIFGSNSINYFSRIWKYKEVGVGTDTDALESLNSQLSQLHANLQESEKLHAELVAVNTELASQVASLNSQIAGLSNQIWAEGQRQADISGQIGAIEGRLGELTAKQAELIRKRIEEANRELHLSDEEPLAASIPDAPFADGFTVASYGAAHWVGMNQYGARGRAIAGQSAEQILDAYFADIAIDKNYGTDYTITVNGNNGYPYYQEFDNVQYNIEEYLKHLYEMPASWPMEALKAQAIAARTYALKYTGNGTSSICPSQSCQVVKLEANAQAWQDAVDATAGWVIKNGGSLITPWYCSTAGGYTKLPTQVGPPYFSGLYDPPWIKAVKDYGPNGAYDGPAYGGSSWYHKAWGEVGGIWGGECSSDCHPWLTNLQMQDLFNVILLRQSAGDQYNEFLSPYYPAVTRQPDAWSEQQVINKLVELGIAPVGHITSISVYTDPNRGDTIKVIVQSDGYAGVEFDAQIFKDIYYLRSPGTLVIKSPVNKTSRFDFVSS